MINNEQEAIAAVQKENLAAEISQANYFTVSGGEYFAVHNAKGGYGWIVRKSDGKVFGAKSFWEIHGTAG